MSLVKKVITRIKIEIARRVGPVMVDRYVTKSGTSLPHVRYGSTTYFQHKDEMELGDHIYIAQNCFIDASRGLSIGEGCQICSFTSILTHSSHISIRLYGRAYPTKNMKGMVEGPVNIGEYCFVGPYAIIMPNTKIGKGSIISAYSYVNGDFPDFSVIAGNPARVIGDTRKMDEEFLKENPELLSHYNLWAKGEGE
jgi:acetyltransferase-like isoleucine patch superfamily enzyme